MRNEETLSWGILGASTHGGTSARITAAFIVTTGPRQLLYLFRVCAIRGMLCRSSDASATYLSTYIARQIDEAYLEYGSTSK